MVALNEDTKARNRIIGDRIANQRKSLKMTQRDLSNKLNLDYYNFVSAMENGTATVPPKLWGPLATVLLMDPQDFAIQCLRQTQPEVFAALFGSIDSHIAVSALKKATAQSRRQEP